MIRKTQDINVRGTRPLISPNELKRRLPISETAAETVYQTREQVKAILSGEDPRLMVVVGPCSIHDPAAAMEYAERLARLADQLREQLLVVMRVYFEKPRTALGWKGLINDPHLDDTFSIEEGLQIARRLLLDITELGLPAATEMLEPITPQYIADLITLSSIGARTTESPTHRQMASGLSMPVGFKNGTDGSLDVAVNAMLAARHPHSFLGIDGEGTICIVQTNGNPWGHLILRGGFSGPNYSAEHIAAAQRKLADAGLPTGVVVDCSHANSNKDYRRQPIVWNDVLEQRLRGNHGIIGMMLESNLFPGKQPLTGNPAELRYGVSITDGCIGWDETEALLTEAAERLGSVVQRS